MTKGDKPKLGATHEPQEDRPSTVRLPYEKPQIIFDEPIEIQASICDPLVGGKVSAGACFGFPSS